MAQGVTAQPPWTSGRNSTVLILLSVGGGIREESRLALRTEIRMMMVTKVLKRDDERMLRDGRDSVMSMTRHADIADGSRTRFRRSRRVPTEKGRCWGPSLKDIWPELSTEILAECGENDFHCKAVAKQGGAWYLCTIVYIGCTGGVESVVFGK
jgi:hypothetical protein